MWTGTSARGNRGGCRRRRRARARSVGQPTQRYGQVWFLPWLLGTVRRAATHIWLSICWEWGAQDKASEMAQEGLAGESRREGDPGQTWKPCKGPSGVGAPFSVNTELF